MYKFEDIIIQSNIDGFYTKRIKVNMQELQTIKHNHRKIGISEVVFDIDCHLRIISDKINDFISSNLITDNISHQVWDTSRSPHIHTFFEDMNLYSQEVRRDIRLLILKHYSGKFFNWIDKSKASENNMIRDFGGIHEVTGKPKTLIYEYSHSGIEQFSSLTDSKIALNVGVGSNGGTPTNKAEVPPFNLSFKTPLNPLNSTILEQLRVLYHQRQKALNLSRIEPSTAITSDEIKRLQDFITYCCETQHTHDGRERILFREVSKACLLLGYTPSERQKIYYNVVKNCKGRHVSDLLQWDKFMQKQNKLRLNWKEIYPYYKRIESV